MSDTKVYVCKKCGSEWCRLSVLSHVTAPAHCPYGPTGSNEDLSDWKLEVSG